MFWSRLNLVEISVLHFMKKFSLILNQLVCTGGDSLLQFVFWCCLSLTGISVLYFTREKKVFRGVKPVGMGGDSLPQHW